MNFLNQHDEQLCRSQPVYENKNAAIQAAIEAEEKYKNKVFEVWKEPDNIGGRYVVASSKAFEALYRGGYKQVVSTLMLTHISRGEHIDEIEEA